MLVAGAIGWLWVSCAGGRAQHGAQGDAARRDSAYQTDSLDPRVDVAPLTGVDLRKPLATDADVADSMAPSGDKGAAVDLPQPDTLAIKPKDAGAKDSAPPPDTQAPADTAPPKDVLSPGKLHPLLPLPPTGSPCVLPGSLFFCPGIQVCRFYTPVFGRCEGCGACGNLHAPCKASADCDLIYTCFAGKCTSFCMLGSSGCGPAHPCINVGHATHGVCKP